jgi:hypothetical protein
VALTAIIIGVVKDMQNNTIEKKIEQAEKAT